MFGFFLSAKFLFGLAVGVAAGAGFHRFWARNAIKAYNEVKGRL